MEDEDNITYEIHMNEHGKIALPKEILAEFSDKVIVTNGPLNELWLYDLSQWEIVEKKMMEAMYAGDADRRTIELIIGNAVDYELVDGCLTLESSQRESLYIENGLIILSNKSGKSCHKLNGTGQGPPIS